MAQSQSREYVAHDRLIKEFFRRFLERFMWLFYEEKAARLDWSQLEFIDKELIINLPGQAMRITDVVVRVPVKASVETTLQTTVDENKREPKNQDEDGESDKEVNDTPEPKAELIIVHIDAEANKPVGN